MQRAGRPKEYLNSLGEKLRTGDPWVARGEFLRPLSIHPLGGKGEGDFWKFGDQKWPVHVILQYGRLTPGDPILYQAHLDNRQFGMPVVNDEYGYMGDSLWRDAEGNRGPSTNHYAPEKHRETMWAIYMAGAYGTTGDKFTYSDGRSYKSSIWHDRPEYRDIAALVKLFTTTGLEYWKMNPDPSLVASGRRVYVLANPGKQYLIWAGDGGSFSVNLAEGRYSAHLYDPREGVERELPDIDGGGPRAIEVPGGQDWAVYLMRR